MDKIYLKIAIAQGMIDLFFNAYQRNHAFTLTEEDIMHYVEQIEETLDYIQKQLSQNKIVREELAEQLRDEWPIESRYTC